MSEARDPGIKLFGRTIAPPAPAEGGEAPAGDEKDTCEEITNTKVKDSMSALEELDQGAPNSSSCLNNGNEDNHQTSTPVDKATVDPTPEQDQTEDDASGQEKVLKKPDKILPCPRCNSLDTKFCYYNNYNVNQPRHFCKNCQRYWTAGGTMRNVPVGAGRRKNKHSASHYRHIMMSSDGLVSTRIDAPDSTHHQALPCGSSSPTRTLKGNGTVLKFGPEAPLCESMASVLNLREQKRNAEFSSMACGESREEPSCVSSVTASNCVEIGFSDNPVHMEQNSMQGYCNGVTPLPHLQCYPGPPWAYPWSPGWNNIAGVAMSASGPPIMAAPAFCAPTIPFPFMPASFWGCMSGWTSGAWNLPWVGTNGGLSPTSSTSNSACSGNGSPTLGKHSRDTSSDVEEKMEKSLWVPKTLRIDDPDEAAKSSIWATLGIKPDEGCIFKAFRSKMESEGQTSDAAQVLLANPAALARSQSFQEST